VTSVHTNWTPTPEKPRKQPLTHSYVWMLTLRMLSTPSHTRIRGRCSERSSSRTIDLLEAIYSVATVSLAQGQGLGGGITFDTGVQQGSVLSPTLFNIFLNPLLRLPTFLCFLLTQAACNVPGHCRFSGRRQLAILRGPCVTMMLRGRLLCRSSRQHWTFGSARTGKT